MIKDARPCGREIIPVLLSWCVLVRILTVRTGMHLALCGSHKIIGEQLDIHTVLLLLAFAMALMNWVGFGEVTKVFAETKFLN